MKEFGRLDWAIEVLPFGKPGPWFLEPVLDQLDPGGAMVTSTLDRMSRRSSLTTKKRPSAPTS